MADGKPGDGGANRLRAYWTTGAGAARLRWGTAGDFERCVTQVNAAIVKGGGKPLGDHEIKGFCSNLHVIATGARPGKAPGEQVEGKA